MKGRDIKQVQINIDEREEKLNGEERTERRKRMKKGKKECRRWKRGTKRKKTKIDKN